MFKKIKQVFKDYFLAGLLVVGPLAICFLFLSAVINWTDSMLQTARWSPLQIPGMGIVLAVVIILVAGFIGRNYLGNFIFNKTARLVEHLPFVGNIYKSLRQVFETLFGAHSKNFSRVVLIPFPNAEIWSLAFVTSESIPQEIQKQYTEPMLGVYVPNTPLPTTGFYMYVAKKNARTTNFTVEQAFKIIISIGLVVPDGY